MLSSSTPSTPVSAMRQESKPEERSPSSLQSQWKHLTHLASGHQHSFLVGARAQCTLLSDLGLTCNWDYLAVMASSVSSERAFSSAGITISKCRNHLKGDIVEALQSMKMVYHSDLLFHEVPLTKELEKDLEDLEPYVPGQEDDWEDMDGGAWDSLVIYNCED
ncbi:hypothetical protein AX14_007730 [Amanita brunnescens Koide BX004]|nr:hypothetical protein AX14_007730 [Amanita brunnescens Koide BX004]